MSESPAHPSSERERPEGVPGDAWWSPTSDTWILGRKNGEGELVGDVCYWRADGSLCCITAHRRGRPHGPFQRFHENGEVSQTGRYEDGKLHGTRTFLATAGPTSETMYASGLSPAIMRAELDYEHGALVANRYFDAEGTALDSQGDPLPSRPAGVPARALFNPKTQCWIAGVWDDEGRRNGPLEAFESDGRRSSLEHYRADLVHGTVSLFYREGTMRSSAEYVDGELCGIVEHYYRDGTLARRGRLQAGEWAGTLEDWDPSGAAIRTITIEPPARADPAPAPSAAEQQRIDHVEEPVAFATLACETLSASALAQLVAIGWGGDADRDVAAARAARRLVRAHGDLALAQALRTTKLDTAPRLLTAGRLRRVLEAMASVDAVESSTLAEALARRPGVGFVAALDGDGAAALMALRCCVQGERLDLNWKGLVCLPLAVRHLPCLRELDAGNNHIETLRPEISDVLLLRALRLGSNHLATLPAALGWLRELRVLHLDDNRFTTLPSVVTRMTELETLNLGSNQLESLPESFDALDRLQTLWLNRNPLRGLPAAFARLTSLSFLHLGDVPWKTLPPVLYELQALRELRVASRDLSELPPDIARLTHLERLFIGSSSLEAIPDELLTMTHLRELNIGHNPLPSGTIERLKEALPDCRIY